LDLPYRIRAAFGYDALLEVDAMPLHDWTRVPAGRFHHFHQDWSIEIARELNRGRLPRGLSALVEQRAGATEPDMLAIEAWQPDTGSGDGGVAALPPPATRIVRRTTKQIYSGRANRIMIKHHLGRIIATIEMLSPGNKDGRAAVRGFVDRTIDCLRRGIHVLIVDVFPPTSRDPSGMHKLIWDEILEGEFVFPAGKDRILASYQTGREPAAATFSHWCRTPIGRHVAVQPLIRRK
jgi:hypothetical protein